jgi:hypothetical protein
VAGGLADGSVHWLRGRFQAFTDNADDNQSMTGVPIDITNRKQAETAMAAGDQRICLATQATGVGIWE